MLAFNSLEYLSVTADLRRKVLALSMHTYMMEEQDEIIRQI